jgi:hypothetical protein
MVLDEEFARFKGRPKLIETAIPGFTVSVKWGKPTHTAQSWSSRVGTRSARPRLPQVHLMPLVTAEPTTGFPNLRAAQEVLEDRLTQWELFADLVQDIKLHFAMRSIYASTNEGGWEELHWGSGSGGSFTVHSPVDKIPSPPARWGVAATPLVQQLREQWQQVRSGRAKILDRAYFCLTSIEKAYGGEVQSAKSLAVSRNVLEEIRKLTASSDPRHARKATTHGPPHLSDVDLRFLSKAVPRLILRVAEVEGGLPVNRLTRQDF